MKLFFLACVFLPFVCAYEPGTFVYRHFYPEDYLSHFGVYPLDTPVILITYN